jgi:hypothetical protein
MGLLLLFNEPHRSIIQLHPKTCIILAYSSLYLLPDEVVTTSPALAPRFTGEVVISVPFLKLLEFLTIPVIDPSLF